jgi:hypothetical protein
MYVMYICLLSLLLHAYFMFAIVSFKSEMKYLISYTCFKVLLYNKLKIQYSIP